MDITFGNNRLSINSEGSAKVDVRSEMQRVSQDEGNSYIWTNETYDYTAADTILLVRNDHSTKNLYIDKIYLYGDTATEVEIHVPTVAFTIAGTAVVGEPLNRTTDRTAQATAKANETGNTQGDVIERVRLNAITEMELDFHGSIVLGYEQSIGIDFVTNGAVAHVSIWGYFK